VKLQVNDSKTQKTNFSLKLGEKDPERLSHNKDKFCFLVRKILETWLPNMTIHENYLGIYKQ
jgi:hypothetical protein